MYQRFHLNHADAARIVDAIRAELDAQGKGAAIAVVAHRWLQVALDYHCDQQSLYRRA